MNKWVQILSLCFILAPAASAQTSVTCGIVGVDGPSNIDPGAPLVFKVKVSNTSNPQFKWNVSTGTIIKGQGTDEITVDSSWLGGQDVTATVELIGAPSGCKSSWSTTTRVSPPPPTRCSFDSYGDIKFEDEKARLDNFAIQVQNLDGSGLIQIYAGQKTFKREAAYRLARAKSYLVNVRGIEPTRIITSDCGFNVDLTTTLWVVPPKATLPECETAFQIPLSEVKFTKPRPKSLKKRR